MKKKFRSIEEVFQHAGHTKYPYRENLEGAKSILQDIRKDIKRKPGSRLYDYDDDFKKTIVLINKVLTQIEIDKKNKN